MTKSIEKSTGNLQNFQKLVNNKQYYDSFKDSPSDIHILINNGHKIWNHIYKKNITSIFLQKHD